MKKLLLLFPLMMMISLGLLFYNVQWGIIGMVTTFVLAIALGFVGAFCFDKEKTACEIIYRDKGGLRVLPYLVWKKRKKFWGLKFQNMGLYREFGYVFEKPNITHDQVLMFSTDSPEYRALVITIDKLYFYGILSERIENPDDAKEIYIYPWLPLD